MVERLPDPDGIVTEYPSHSLTVKNILPIQLVIGAYVFGLRLGWLDASGFPALNVAKSNCGGSVPIYQIANIGKMVKVLQPPFISRGSTGVSAAPR